MDGKIDIRLIWDVHGNQNRRMTELPMHGNQFHGVQVSFRVAP
jgi:hypothetical protein